MATESADRNRPAFVVFAETDEERYRSVDLVARISDLDCRPICIASDFDILGKSGKPGEPPTINRDFISKHVYTCHHRDNYAIRPLFTDFRYEVYPLSDEDVEFFKPYIDAIERVYARK